jgi:hypothetical protein
MGAANRVAAVVVSESATAVAGDESFVVLNMVFLLEMGPTIGAPPKTSLRKAFGGAPVEGDG